MKGEELIKGEVRKIKERTEGANRRKQKNS